jgi:thioesterase domain-containing protein
LDDDAIAGLRKFLRQQLPGYMVPTRYSILPALPMTPNGKVDHKQLPEPQLEEPTTRASEPRDDLERMLAGIWKDLLSLPDVGIHDNFFDLGGHSLLAFMLMAKLKTMLGRELPLAALFRAPTIAGLAEELRSAGETAFSYLVPLRPWGKGRPIYIVHGIFGNVLQLAELAKLLHADRPVYALQARGADPAQEPHSTIAEMVDAYLDAIRSLQKAGPFAIAGYSFGGLIAFEMARRLSEQGEEVDFLGLLETDLYERYLPWADKLRYQLILANRVIGKLASLPLSRIPGYLFSKVRQVWVRCLVRAGWRDHPVSLEGIGGALSDRYYDMYQIGAREFRAFRPKPYGGRIDLFAATGPRYDTCDPLPIWRLTGKSVEVHTIAGAHETIMEQPHVQSLAAELGKCLAGLERASTEAVEPPQPLRQTSSVVFATGRASAAGD